MNAPEPASGRAGPLGQDAGGPAPVSAILLAAGASTRFGAQKLLVPVAGVPLVCWAARHARAAGIAELVVVLGRQAVAVQAALAGDASSWHPGPAEEGPGSPGDGPPPLRFVRNRRYAAGMAGSIRAGVRAVAAHAAAALVLLGDQPAVAPPVIDRLIDYWRTGGGAIVAPSYRGFRGNPVLFDRALFPELLRLRGDEGARGIIAAQPHRLVLVPFDREPPPDVDTPADGARLAAGESIRGRPAGGFPDHAGPSRHPRLTG